jgi:YggT family protein
MQAVLLLVELLFQVLVGAAFLRAWMNGLRVNMRMQPGLFVMALTDWLVKPLRRWMPQSMARGRLDWGSVIAAVLLALVYAGAFNLLTAAATGHRSWVSSVPSLGLVFLLRTVLQTWSLLLIVLVILSWVQPASPLHHSLSRLMAPLLAPLRQLVPLIGGVDLSPAILLLVLQLALVLLG